MSAPPVDERAVCMTVHHDKAGILGRRTPQKTVGKTHLSLPVLPDDVLSRRLRSDEPTLPLLVPLPPACSPDPCTQPVTSAQV